MRQRLRTLLLCLLFVSLPMQSIAGVTRFQCAMAQTAFADMGGATRGDAIQGGMAMAAVGSPMSDGDCESMASDTCASCGKCAGCCTGSYAAPPVATLAVVQTPVSIVRPRTFPPFTGPFLARLDRPPRIASSLQRLMYTEIHK